MRSTHLVVAFVACVICSNVLANEPEPVLTDAALRQILEERIKAKKAVGVVVGRLQGTNRSIVAAGTMALTNSRPVDGDTVFEIGSITKAFTGTLLADMANRGEVQPDDPAAKYSGPSVTIPSRNGKLITLAHLASHRSGLPREPAGEYGREKALEFLSSYELTRNPGSAYQYSNLGAGLLADLLGRRGGTSYEQLILDRICKPLGMNDTRISPSAEMQKRMATGHDYELKPAKFRDTNIFVSAAAFRSTANDFLKLLAAVLNPGDDTVSKAIVTSQAGRTITGLPGMEVAWGWHFKTASDEIIWHSGKTFGFHSFAGVNRKRNRAVVIFSNCTHSIDTLGFRLLDPSGEPDESTLERYVGTYELTPTDALTVSREKGELYVGAEGQTKAPIFASGRDQFYGEAGFSLSFGANASGMVTNLIFRSEGKEHRLVRKNGQDDVAREVRRSDTGPRRPKMIFPPFVDLQVPLAPTPVKANGKQCLVYEVHITNFFTNKLELTRVEVLGDRSKEPLASYSGEELVSQIAHVGFIDRAVAGIAGLTVPSDQPDERIIGPGLRAVMFLLLTVEKESDIPRALRHRLFFKPTAMSASDAEDVVEGAQIDVVRERPLVLGPPVRGEGWLAAGALSNTNYHRRSVFPIDGRGRARISQRFAIDWSKRGPDGNTYRDGYANTNAYGYGEEVLAVANAVVADLRDGIPDNDPASKETEIPFSLQTAAGNYVFLDLSNGRFAHYAHLQPNSIRVRRGQKVRRGQVLGRLGNSGHSHGPHLHFDVVNANSPFGAEGVPYVFDSFEVQGVLSSLGDTWKPPPNAKTDKRRMEMPTENAVIRFPR